MPQNLVSYKTMMSSKPLTSFFNKEGEAVKKKAELVEEEKEIL